MAGRYSPPASRSAVRFHRLSAIAPVAELVDALDSKSSSARSAGSIPARGTKLKTLIITTTYAMGWIPDFQKYFLGTLKIHVKIHSSRPFCWHFCWYRWSKRSRRISAIPNERIEQMARKNHGASAKPKQRRLARFRIPEPRHSRSV